jgi:spermidine synthase
LRQDDPARRFSLADALEEAGETGKAAELFAATRRADPDGPAKARKTAWKLATEKSAGARDPWEAVRLARLASRAVGGRDPEYLDTLAAAYAAAGDFTRAEQTARTALALADGNRELARTIAERLQRYEKKQALVVE